MTNVAESKQEKRSTLVLGGTGKTGRRVAERLREYGLPFRVGSRTGEPAFDWEDQSTWALALKGVESAYVVYSPDLAVPGAADNVRSFTELAVKSGVRRLVLLSGRGEKEALLAEQAVRESDAEWTIVRASWFCQNFSEDFLLEGVLTGEVILPVGDVAEPFIDCEDIADVVVASLTKDGHAGQIYEVTGPRLLTFTEAVGEIAKAAGREIRYVAVSPEQYASMLAEQGVPEEYVWLFKYLFTTVFDGRNAYVADGVQRALGREPRDFTDYVWDTAATGVWGVEGLELLAQPEGRKIDVRPDSTNISKKNSIPVDLVAPRSSCK